MSLAANPAVRALGAAAAFALLAIQSQGPALAQSAAGFPASLIEAARADPAYGAKIESLAAQRSGAEAAAMRAPLSLSFAASARADAAPIAGSYGLPLGASASLSFPPRGPEELRRSSLEAGRAAASAEGGRALEEALFRILEACLRAAAKETALARAEETAARKAASGARSRGEIEDAARASLQAAQSALDVETARSERDQAREEARRALGADPPDASSLTAFLRSAPGGASAAGDAEAAVLRARAQEASAALAGAERARLRPSLGLSASFDPLKPEAFGIALSGSLSYAPPEPSERARAEAIRAAAAAALSAASAELAAQGTRLDRLSAEIASLERRLPLAERAVESAAALADLAEARLALWAITVSERDAALDLVSEKRATRDGIVFQLLGLELERGRVAGTLAARAEAAAKDSP